MNAAAKVLAFGIILSLAGCSGKGSDTTGPDSDPPTNDPGTPAPHGIMQGSYLLEQINQSTPGKLVTISNPDGEVIGLYRFDAASRLELQADQAFALTLLYSNDIKKLILEDRGQLEQAGAASDEGAMPLTFTSATYGDAFTGVVLGDIVAVKYDFDGDGEMETSLGFRRVE
jgi:hypothetical protein